ncbi:hypothetical protein [Aurantiacibacter luteus]|uniref:Uncharacterized protein n=1 Tax=Aurantiacibacter luteus TaxID=1581420 RepID=A0A0G9MVB5_9SPHN|nr:hypothetical protein [Aurantiacibacter luteus]KLE34544.1 hypothetical protein AAW00_10060 [Aurantiacibacter luteus]
MLAIALAALPMPTAAQEAPPLPAALHDAVTICEQTLEGEARLPPHAALYTSISAEQAELLDMHSTTEAPDLIQRFADTTPAGRQPGPVFIHVASREGGVWSVHSVASEACDTAVNGLADPQAASAALVETLQANGWQLHDARGVGDDAMPLYRYLLVRDLDGVPDTRVRVLAVQGLNVGADPEGIQFELLMTQGTAR